MSHPPSARLGWALCAAFIGVADVITVALQGPSVSTSSVLPSAAIVAAVAVAISLPAVVATRLVGRWLARAPLDIAIVLAVAAFWWLCDRQISGYFRAGPSVKWLVLAVGLALSAAIVVAWCCDRLIRLFPALGRMRTWVVVNGLAWVCVGGLAAEPYIGAAERRHAPADAPSVLLVTIDTLRADRVGAYGYSKARTPVLDELAREGVLFRQAITQSVFTAPSHATILTGLTPTRHGVRTNEMRLDREVPILADALGPAGWSTFAAVSGLPVQQSGLGVLSRFDAFDDDFHDIRAIPELVWRTTMGHLARAALTAVEIERQPWYRSATDVTDAALRELQDAEPGPFFGWVHYYDPHLPYEAPDAFLSDEARRYVGPADGKWYDAEEPHRSEVAGDPAAMEQMSELYDAEVAYADSQLRRLVDAAMQKSAGHPLWIFVMADHGESFGEHTIFFSRDVYDQTIRVPLVVWSTALTDHGREVVDQVRLMDVAPTILEVAGLTDALATEGVSLLGLMTGRPGPLPDRSISERLPHSDELVRGTFAVRDGRWKAVWRLRGWEGFGDAFIRAESRELYDLHEDPQELRNVATRYPATLNELREWGRRHESALAPSGRALSDERREILRSLGYIR